MKGPRVLVLGASGRIGSMLQRHWNPRDISAVWQVRHPVAAKDHLVFDPLDEPAAIAARCGRLDVVLGLAGVVPGRGDLSLNAPLGRAALEIGAATGARHVFTASSAAVYGPSRQPLREDAPLRPASDYGAQKARMEQDLLRLASALKTAQTALRIGNVAGADALLAQPGTERLLDRFDDGSGPRRSYIGPKALADILAQLVRHAAAGLALPEALNIALPGAVGMEQLCHAAGLNLTWRKAPDTALPLVELDVTRLQALVPCQPADAGTIIADWRADKALC